MKGYLLLMMLVLVIAVKIGLKLFWFSSGVITWGDWVLIAIAVAISAITFTAIGFQGFKGLLNKDNT